MWEKDNILSHRDRILDDAGEGRMADGIADP